VKYEELLIILLKNQPELAGIFFDYAKPEKINLEEFMNRNYKFNVSVERFAYLTGRSISAFKRDFKTIFNQTPNRWLIQKRLQEAYFLISKKGEKASQIYLDLGFEALSHFSYAFKKLFGITPTELAEQNKISN
jgi:AraC-like DNA-binding protein